MFPQRTTQRDDQDLRKQLVNSVFRDDSRRRVRADEVTLLIWLYRDDPSIVQFMAQIIAKFATTQSVIDGIEFFLPQIAHMIIHLEVDWSDAILERFALIIAQQSFHFAMQLFFILQGASEDYRPILTPGKHPNPKHNPEYYGRCIKLMAAMERCVVYGNPSTHHLKILYEKGKITRYEYQQLELADRRFTAAMASSEANPFAGDFSAFGGEMKCRHVEDTDCAPNLNRTWRTRYLAITERRLFWYNQRPSVGGKLKRTTDLVGAIIVDTPPGARGHPVQFEIHTRRCVDKFRAQDPAEKRQWIKVLMEESDPRRKIPTPMGIVVDDDGTTSSGRSHASYDNDSDQDDESTAATLSQRRPNQQVRLVDLTPSERRRYDFLKQQRQFVTDMCQICEELRLSPRMGRKTLAPQLVEQLKIPEMAYVPLCQSTDVWRRIVRVMPQHTKVFNTSMRCPTILYFVCKRGERASDLQPLQPLPASSMATLTEETDATDETEADEAQIKPLPLVPNNNAMNKHERFDVNANVSEVLLHQFGVANADILGTHLEDESKEDRDKDEQVKKHILEMSLVYADCAQEAEEAEAAAEASSERGDRHVAGQRMPSVLVRQMLDLTNATNPPPDAAAAPPPPGPLASTRSLGSKRGSAQLRRRTKTALEMSTMPLQNVQILDGVSTRNLNAPSSRAMLTKAPSYESGRSLFEGDLDMGWQTRGGIDRESLARAASIICGGETWAAKSQRLLQEEAGEAASDGSVVEVVPVMAKSYDDLRQEVFVMQLIHYYQSVFAKANLPLWLKTYRIQSVSKETGLLEFLVDCTSLKGLYQQERFPKEGGLRAYFEMVYGTPMRKSFLTAQRNFMLSCAGYSLICYLLGIKDRHDGNVMLDLEGRIMHIDFGYVMGQTLGGAKGVPNLERAPFKLTRDYIDVMGGVDSDCFDEFKRLFVEGFMAARANSQVALGLVEIMMFQSNFPCFSGWMYGGEKARTQFERRMMLHVKNDSVVRKRAAQLVDDSVDHCCTFLYDWASVRLDEFQDKFNLNIQA